MNLDKKRGCWGIKVFGMIEIGIGLVSLISQLVALPLGVSTKPLTVLVFVLTASALSLVLGVGILRYSLSCYHLLLFFAKAIILSKLLIFLNVISLSGALETTIPPEIKNTASIFYHLFLLWYFSRAKVRECFRERRNVLFSMEWPGSRRL